jgi:DNA repair protein RecO (recombination protein O)
LAELNVRGIVIRRRESGESDRRLTLLTRELGKIDIVAKGARKSASRLSGASEPLTLAIFCLASGKRNRYVTQAQSLASFNGLRRDFDRLSMAFSLIELFAALVPSEQPEPELFEHLENSLFALESHSKPLVAIIWAEARLLSLSGFTPELSHCVVTGDSPMGDNCWLSPKAGGLIGSQSLGGFVDRFEAKREVVIGLDRIGTLTAPPANLKLAEGVFAALVPFLRFAAETALPATDALLELLRDGSVRRQDK